MAPTPPRMPRASARPRSPGSPIRDPEVLATLHEAVDGFRFTDADVGAAGRWRSRWRPGCSPPPATRGGRSPRAALTINDERVAAIDAPVPPPIAGEWLVVRAGKRRLAVGRRSA